MARTTKASRPAIETKALAEENKSAGMRLLFEADYSVVQVKEVFNAPYGYVYGVAQRAGFVENAAARRSTKATKAKTPVKAAKAPAKAKAATKAPVKAPAKTAAAKTPAKAAAKPAAKPPVKARATATATVPAVTEGTPPVTIRKVAATPANGSAVARVAAKLAAKQPGRPTPARRAANRKQPAAQA